MHTRVIAEEIGPTGILRAPSIPVQGGRKRVAPHLRHALSRLLAKRHSPPTLLYFLAGPPALCPTADSLAVVVFTFAALLEGDQSGNGRWKGRDQDDQVVGNPSGVVERRSLEGIGANDPDNFDIGLIFSVPPSHHSVPPSHHSTCTPDGIVHLCALFASLFASLPNFASLRLYVIFT